MRARRKLVHQQPPVARDEKLDAEEADVVQRVHHRARHLLRLDGDGSRHLCRTDRHVEDVMAMRVLERRKTDTSPIDAAGPNDRDLAFEIDERFQDGFGASERPPGSNRRVRCRDTHLPLAVVSECGGLQHGGAADAGQRGLQVGLAPDGSERNDRDAVPREKCLFPNPVLRDRERMSVRPDNRVRLGRRRRRRRHVLELEGDDRHAAGELAHGVDVVVRRVDFDVRNLPCRCVVLGRERVHAISETPRRHRKHTTELAAAEHANRGSGQDASHLFRFQISDCRFIADFRFISDCRLQIDSGARKSGFETIVWNRKSSPILKSKSEI